MKQDKQLTAALRCFAVWLTAVLLLGLASVELLAEETSFSLPPRKIDDITALLDQAEIADKGEYKRLLAIVGEAPLAGASKADLARFYTIRGAAAADLGNTTQALDDLREAARIVEEANIRSSRSNARLYLDLAWVELQVGNYQSAIRAARKSNHTKPIGGSFNALVSMNAWIGNFEEASRWRQWAKDTIRVTGRWGAWGRFNLARIEGVWLDVQGKWREAEAFHRRALRHLIETGQELQYPSGLPNTHLRVAYALLRQGRAVEAEVEARQALTIALERFGKHGDSTLRALRRLAQTLLAQGRYDEAEKIGRIALNIYGQMGTPEDSFAVSVIRLGLANSLAAQGEWDGALGQFDTAREHLVENSVLYDKWYAGNPTHIIALIRGGRAAEAVEPAERALQRREERLGAKHYDTAEASGVLAMALAATGQANPALAAFASSVKILLSRSRQSDDETGGQAMRDKRLEAILDSYIDLLSLIVGTPAVTAATVDPVAESFRLADVVRGQSVQRAIAANAVRGAARDPALAELVREEQDARRQISALFGLLAKVSASDPAEQDPDAMNQIRTLIDELRDRRAELMAQIEGEFPDYAQLINPKPLNVEEARKQLRPGEALIAIYVGERRSFVWAVPQKGAVAFAAVPLGRDDIGFDVDYLRGALDAKVTTLGAIPDFDIEIAHELYQALLEPVIDGWQNAKSLLIVAHRPLDQLPFALLSTEPFKLPRKETLLFDGYRAVPWLARSQAVTVLPSVASLVTLRAMPRSNAARRAFAGFGDPWFNVAQAAQAMSGDDQAVIVPSRGDLALSSLPIRLLSLLVMDNVDSAELARLPRLPDTADEVRSIALALNADMTQDVFTGKAANETRVKTMDLSDRKVIVFATHGLVPGDLNGLTQPAIALTSPAIVGGEDDGLLTMSEILGLKLDADWVVLSACNTASGAGAGAEAVSGLGRAFFYAGARALLVSNWPVHSQSAKDLTTDLFPRQAADPSLTRAEALRQSMLAMIDGGAYADPTTGELLFAYAHPIFWAPFTLIGDGG